MDDVKNQRNSGRDVGGRREAQCHWPKVFTRDFARIRKIWLNKEPWLLVLVRRTSVETRLANYRAAFTPSVFAQVVSSVANRGQLTLMTNHPEGTRAFLG